MSLAGVRSNRGDAYQTLVAFDWALSILSNDKYQWLEVDSTSLDAKGKPIAVDDVVIGLSDESTICCQCKKNQPDFKPWSVADLGDELAKAAQFVANNPKSQVIFYTRGSFGALAKLREHSTTQPNKTAYQKSLTKDHQKIDTDLAKLIADYGISTYDLLQQITFETSPKFERMRELLKERLAYLVSNAEDAFNALWTRLDSLGARVTNNGNSSTLLTHRLTKTDLHDILVKSGATFVLPLSQQEIQKSFANASAVGRDWRRDIAGNQLYASAISELLNAIETRKHSVLLTGTPGSGKTCVLLSLQEELEKRSDLATLFIQAREYANCTTPEARSSLGLPSNLIGQVGRMSDYRHTIVIIDSLDVLSLSREHTVLSFFLAQIDQLLLIPNVTVIAACREFDRKYDRRLSEREWDQTVNNAPLDWETVVSPLVSKIGVDPASLDTITRNLLQNPRELAIFADIAQQAGGFNIATSQALSRKYLETIVQSDAALGETAMIAIEQMANRMLKSRRLDIPHMQIQVSDEIFKRLLSTGVLHQNQSGNIEYGHQTLLDVLVVSGAERDQLTLKSFIEKLPAVPFVRPTIRAYVAYLAAGDRLSFRRQLRAVFDSNAAFHIRRLVAESLAEQIPQDEDWSLIQHLRRQHRELFNSLYEHGHAIEWHHFWLKFLVPLITQEHDSQSLIAHVNRIASWKKADPKGVLSFWLNALKYDWVEHNRIAQNIAFELRDIDSDAGINTGQLLEKLLTLPHQEIDFLGDAIVRHIDTGGANDALLWRYIAGDIKEEDLLKYHFGHKLKCGLNEFASKDFLCQRMLQSEYLLDLAIASIEQWSCILNKRYHNNRDWYDNFLRHTSYGSIHSRHDTSHAFEETMLFQAIENAIIHHANEHTGWWINHRAQLCRSHEGALRYFAILALTHSPERNVAEIGTLILDKKMLESNLRYELGNLLNASFVYLNECTQDSVLSLILTLGGDENIEENLWILRTRVELISAIPAYLRSPEAQMTLIDWERKSSPFTRQPYVDSRSGRIAAPFSYERFLCSTDEAVLKILSHYTKEGRNDWERDFLIGGAKQVEWQLSEASSRSPTRFIHLLIDHWIDIPDRFKDDILNGVATYLAQRYGNPHFDTSQWIPIEIPDPSVLARLILDEIERHPSYWHHCRAAAKALEASANVIENEHDATRLLFIAIGFANCQESGFDNDEKNLIHIGINMIRGDIAAAVMIIATRWAEKHRLFPDLLEPTLKRFARDPHPAVRALILQRLPYFQSLLPELGWEIFHLILENSNEHLWKIAEPCLYYAYHNRFNEVSRILERIVSVSTGETLETWGRISALAALSEHINLHEFVTQLRRLGSTDAWKGAASVWSNNENVTQHPEQCFFGIQAGLKEAGNIASTVAEKVSTLFGKHQPLVPISPDIFDKYLSIIERDQSNGHFHFNNIESWLNAASQLRPDDTLDSAEKLAAFIRSTKHPIYSFGALSQLLTRLFREAEEREESDTGTMLRRVISLQDSFLVIGINGLQEWLRDAERP
ncbi:ATP-binding protein [Nitrosomonas sp. sh817]|uniref:ATP-binding protein n=1 Tax=Nitrosomonas sp. sh817 TaxID=3070658 RepID=UPI0027DAF1C4|nr:ATP-binding protein [Nitrosomonas sp. sh817]WMJ09397.1 ATP-binding protein [Nitrosomonas sp. sh817]